MPSNAATSSTVPALQQPYQAHTRARQGLGARVSTGIGTTGHGFARAWDDTLESAIEQLEAEAVRRAKDGSDQLLMFLLRARRPELYSERHRVHHSGQIVRVPPSVGLTPEGAQAAHEFLGKLREARDGDEAREALASTLRKRPAAREAS